MTIDEAIDQEVKRISYKKKVLDLGGYDGGVCNTAVEAGAGEAICVDDGSWKTYDNWHEFELFPSVIYYNQNFMDCKIEADIVILKNVIYHQRNPWKTMEHVRTLTKGVLLLATSYIPGEDAVWRVYRPFEGHPVSWTVAWRPTLNGLVTLLEATGFKNIEFLVKDDQGSCALRAEPGELPIGFGERN